MQRKTVQQSPKSKTTMKNNSNNGGTVMNETKKTNQNNMQMTETEKERWLLIAAIASAVGQAITIYITSKK